MRNIFFVRWGTDFNGNYSYGAKLELLDFNRVSFSAPLMPTGKIIKTWESKTEFHAKRNSPMLPLLTQETMYELQVVGEYLSNDVIQLAIDFLDNEDQLLERKYFTDLKACFVYPKKAASYAVHLVNKNHDNFIFDYLKISEQGEVNKFVEVIDSESATISYINEENVTNIIVVVKNNLQTLSLAIDVDQQANYHFIQVDRNNLCEQLLNFYQMILEYKLANQHFIIKPGVSSLDIKFEYYYITKMMRELLQKEMEITDFAELTHIEKVKQGIFINYSISKLLLNDHLGGMNE